MTEDPVAWLYGLQSHGVKLGLDGITELLALLGHPERAYPAVLIGGTNGKGSVSAMLDAMLRASGRRVGLYTSPHLIRPNERIRVDGADLDDPGLHDALETVRAACELGLAKRTLAAHPSFFEVMTAAALWTFRQRGIDAAVLEVGLGGRLDATNATEPLTSAIVTIGFDHVAMLGDTLAAIAGEKAGIVRRGRPLVSGVAQEEAIAVIRARCELVGAPFIDGRRTELPQGARLSLDGAHQVHNARIAVATLHELAREIGLGISEEAIRKGLEATRWPGRLQLIPGAPSILLDGAHNAESAEALAAHLASRAGPKPVWLFATMADKDVRGIAGPLAPHVERVVTTKPGVHRAANSDALAEAARGLGLASESVPDVGQALDRARERAGRDGLVLVAGSLYLVGEVAGLIEGRGAPGPVAM